MVIGGVERGGMKVVRRRAGGVVGWRVERWGWRPHRAPSTIFDNHHSIENNPNLKSIASWPICIFAIFAKSWASQDLAFNLKDVVELLPSLLLTSLLWANGEHDFLSPYN
eukprot:729647-Prorocentrum_minimum.AAC.1